MNARIAALAFCLAFEAYAAAGDVEVRIATGSERGTAIDVARDIAVLAAPDARVVLGAQASPGSVENVKRLRSGSVRLALVQADVYQAYVDLAASGDAEAAELIRPLRVVMPLFSEEIHFVVRADSPLRFVDEIRNARINLGERGSGSALTAASLYRLLFDAAIPDRSTSHHSDEEALVRLVGDRSVDVVVIVGGQPMRLIEDMKPEARQLVRLLRFSDIHASRDKVLARYAPTMLREASYPNLLDRDIEALAVRTLLFTTEEVAGTPQSRDAVVRLAGALCRNLDRLKRHGHPKWREVEAKLPTLERGWAYDPATARVISTCIADRVGRR